MSKEYDTLPVGRIDLSFEDPASIIRTTLLSFLPSISGDAENMREGLEKLLEEVGDAPITISCSQTEDGISLLFLKDVEKKKKSNLILPG